MKSYDIVKTSYDNVITVKTNIITFYDFYHKYLGIYMELAHIIFLWA
jgi:hypothetical protein